MTNDELKKILEQHRQWLNGNGGCRADLRGAVLRDADLCGADLCHAYLCGANLSNAYLCGAVLRDADLSNANLSNADLYRADLRNAYLCGADLSNANLRNANLSNADLSCADLRNADLYRADLSNADLRNANLSNADLYRADLRNADLSNADLYRADLRNADLCGANLSNAYLCGADLRNANLCGAENMVKLMGVYLGNRYYKAIGDGLCNNGYTYTVGLNTLRDGEAFASDDRVLCSAPGFHFASESWCKAYYGDRRYLCVVRIPTKEEYENIEINEPWATDGKASASAIIIEKVFDTRDGNKDVTDQFIDWADGKGNKTKG